MSDFFLLICMIVLPGLAISIAVYFISAYRKNKSPTELESMEFTKTDITKDNKKLASKRYVLLSTFIADNLSYTMIDVPVFTKFFNLEDTPVIIKEIFEKAADTNYFEYDHESLNNMIFKVQNKLEHSKKNKDLSFERYSKPHTRFSLVFRITKVSDE